MDQLIAGCDTPICVSPALFSSGVTGNSQTEKNNTNRYFLS